MLSKAVLKYLKSLQIKKYRVIHQAFVVEGAKSVLELLQSDFVVEKLFVTENFHIRHNGLLQKGFDFEIVPEEELVRAGTFESNNAALAIARMKDLPPLTLQAEELVLALDDIRDPGNLGTIIRIADWYGIRKIICSETCTDFYNPKTIAASMGSFTRVGVHYLDLPEFLKRETKNLPVYGAAMEGKNVHQLQLEPKGILVMGNEANGLRQEVRQQLNSLVSIPRFGGAESLNVATATAILLDNFLRQRG